MGNQKRPVKQAILWGIVSLAAYLALFLNQEIVTNYFARGGAFAIAVVLTAMAFSFIHGAFASYLLEMLGIRPLKKGVH
ncbi:hypothetical protein [Desulfofundulus thermosubterraneus]|uniref:Uncharacterized protein n=1 Tax=Desulfofundulus thermosubterraneus DSM 16057 TaxID=1121432 RepID=A0A1M6ANX7_9FIRM|nr:hypothetical protein [Desulfofundulus thermosubterraneus]SHI38214.1 hypothetical protein SAMN02745219_00221 [Desulfofundulus thermosubterraneus DSM 16057]